MQVVTRWSLGAILGNIVPVFIVFVNIKAKAVTSRKKQSYAMNYLKEKKNIICKLIESLQL